MFWLLFFLLILGLLSLYTIPRALKYFRKKREMEKQIYFAKIIFGSNHDTKKAIEQMTGFFNMIYTSTSERLSFELHKEHDKIILLTATTSPFLLDTIKRYLIGFEGVRVENLESDPFLNYETEPHACRLYSLNDCQNLNLELNFFYELVNFLSNTRSQKAGVSFIVRPAKGYNYKAKNTLFEIEQGNASPQEPSFFDSLNELFFGREETRQQDPQAITQKIRFPVYSVEILTHSSDPHAIRSLTSTFNALGYDNFKIEYTKDERGRKIAFNRLFARYVGDDSVISEDNRVNETGLYLNALELAFLVHPENLQNTAFENDNIKLLTPPQSFLIKHKNQIPIGEYTSKTGGKNLVYLNQNILDKHTAVVGQTGSGKSVFTNNFFLTLAKANPQKSLVFLDPHGTACLDILERLEDWENVIYLKPSNSQKGFIFTINPLFYLANGKQTKEQVKDYQINKIEYLMDIFRDNQNLGNTIENSLYLLIKSGVYFAEAYKYYLYAVRNLSKEKARKIAQERQITFNDLVFGFNDNYRYQELFKIVFEHTEPKLFEDWTKNIKTFSETTGIKGAVSRLKLLANEKLEAMFEGNKFNLFEETLSKKRVLLPIDNDSYPSTAKKLIMRLFLNQAWEEAQRISPEINEVKNLHDTIYFLDEAEEIGNMNTTAKILSQARKYKLNLFLICQFFRQFDPDLKLAIKNNIGTLFSFKVGADEARETSLAFLEVSTQDLLNCPRFKYYSKTTDQQTGETANFLANSLWYEHDLNNHPICHERGEISDLNDFCLRKYGDTKKDLLERAREKQKNPLKYFLENLD